MSPPSRLHEAVQRLRLWPSPRWSDRREQEDAAFARDWADVESAFFDLARSSPLRHWSREDVADALEALAMDDESGHFIDVMLPEPHQELVVDLAEASLDGAPVDARRQLAEALARIPGPRSEALLLRFLNDSDVFVRRCALDSLACLRSDETEASALSLWERESNLQVRMTVLWALRRIGSPRSAGLTEEAIAGDSPDLAAYARRLEAGELDDE